MKTHKPTTITRRDFIKITAVAGGVLGSEAGLDLIEQTAGVEGFLVDKALAEYQSTGLSVL